MPQVVYQQQCAVRWSVRIHVPGPCPSVQRSEVALCLNFSQVG
jgi:hypothetical protein